MTSAASISSLPGRLLERRLSITRSLPLSFPRPKAPPRALLRSLSGNSPAASRKPPRTTSWWLAAPSARPSLPHSLAHHPSVLPPLPPSKVLRSPPENDSLVPLLHLPSPPAGIFFACALQLRGLSCCVVERAALRGRVQEWNISRKELAELAHLGVLTTSEAEACIASEFNPGRCGFHGGPAVSVRDILNLGVSPDKLLQAVRARFEAAGGVVRDNTPLSGVRRRRRGHFAFSTSFPSHSPLQSVAHRNATMN